MSSEVEPFDTPAGGQHVRTMPEPIEDTPPSAPAPSPMVAVKPQPREGSFVRQSSSSFMRKKSGSSSTATDSPSTSSPTPNNSFKRAGKLVLGAQKGAAALKRQVSSSSSPSRVRGQGASDGFKKQTASFAAQLKQRDRDRVWVMDPRDSLLLSGWDFITTVALLYTAILTPFEVGFLAPTTSVDGWFVINRVLDGIFALDMGLQFCVVYQQTSDTPDSDQDAAWVTERRKIVRHYVFGWFPLDLFSLVPSAFDIVPVVEAARSPDAAQDTALAEKLSGFRFIRALRLIKLIRLVRASRLLTRWQARIGLSHSTITSAKIVLMVVIAAHWYACLFALQAQLHDDPAPTWLGLQGFCIDTPFEPPLGAPPGKRYSGYEIFQLQCAGLGIETFYIAAFSWALFVITGLGGTDAYPSKDNAETICVTLLVVLGAFMWAKVLGTFCDLATNSDPGAVEYRQAMDDLNAFCRSHHFEPELRRRLRQYFHQRKHVMMAKSASGVIHKMSTSLQIECVMLVHAHWLKHIWFLRGAEEACLVQIALRMEPFVFAPGELPETTHLYIIHRGIVVHEGRVLTSGKMWGEEMILLDPARQSKLTPKYARCMTFVEVYSISRDAFQRVTLSFDTAARLVRRGMILLIARRGIIALVKQLKSRRVEGDGRSFIEMILDAADNQMTGTRARINMGGEGGGGVAGAQVLDELAVTRSKLEAVEERMEQLSSSMGRSMRGMQDQMAALAAAVNRAVVERPPGGGGVGAADGSAET